MEIRVVQLEERTSTMKEDIQDIKQSLKESKNFQIATLIGVIVSIGLIVIEKVM
jgi:uncharacterized Tic20 family protein